MEKQIKELNTYVTTKLAPSPIAGVGVFALRHIKAGQPLYADMMTKVFTLPYSEFDGLYSEVRQAILEHWPQVVNGSHFMWPDTQIQAFMNHSDDPNYDAVNDLALKDIKEGDEILEDYRKIPNANLIYPWLSDVV